MGDTKKDKIAVWEYLLPAAGIVSLLISCIIISAKKYYWNDELFSYYMTSEPSFTRMAVAFHDKLNNTPFLYFLLGWHWDKLFGSSELSLRVFSSVGMGIALVATWIVIRRNFNLWATALGTLTVFCTSRLLLEQNAEARMYGLFLAANAIAFLLYDKFYKNIKPLNRLLILNSLIHIAIVHTQLFGGFYSGAILLAFLITDNIYKLFRPKLYISIIISWLSIIFYLPSFLVQADAGKPRTWVPIPDLSDLSDVYNITSSLFIDRIVLFLFLVFTTFYIIKNVMKPNFIHILKPSKSEIPLIIFGVCFLLLPLFVWLFSLSIKPIFVDRYMIPSLVGWVILITFLISKTKSEYFRFSYQIKFIFKIFYCCLILYVLIKPVSKAIAINKQVHPEFDISNSNTINKYRSLPKVVTDTHKFMKLNYYSDERKQYYFILDWKSAIHSKSGAFQPQTYKHMQAWKRNFPQYFSNNVLTGGEFLSKHRRFLVIDYPNYLKDCPDYQIGINKGHNMDCPKWLEINILNNNKYLVKLLSSDNTSSILLVQRRDTVALEAADEL